MSAQAVDGCVNLDFFIRNPHLKSSNISYVIIILNGAPLQEWWCKGSKRQWKKHVFDVKKHLAYIF